MNDRNDINDFEQRLKGLPVIQHSDGLRDRIFRPERQSSNDDRIVPGQLLAWLHSVLSPGFSVAGLVLLATVTLLIGGVVIIQTILIKSPKQDEPDGFGQELERFVDVTGDGIDELLIGAFSHEYGEDGETLGSSATVYLFDVIEQSMVYSFAGPEPNLGFGSKVGIIGDVTGDGIPEVCCYGDWVSRVFLFDGATGEQIKLFESPRPLPLHITDDPGKTAFGLSVSRLPDVNGDGIDEFAIGQAEWNRAPGRVFVYDGATLSVLYEVNSPNPRIGGRFYRVKGVPDVNGDGKGDLLISAQYEDVETDQGLLIEKAGRAYLVSGGSGELLHSFVSPNSQAPDSEWKQGSNFGYSMEQIGDVDGDGFKDIAIGAHHEAPGQSLEDMAQDDRPGRVYIFSVITGELLHELQPPNPSDAWYGMDIQSLPDLTGDQVEEFAVLVFLANRYDVLDGSTFEPLMEIKSPDARNVPEKRIVRFSWLTQNRDQGFYGFVISEATNNNSPDTGNVIVLPVDLSQPFPK